MGINAKLRAFLFAGVGATAFAATAFAEGAPPATTEDNVVGIDAALSHAAYDTSESVKAKAKAKKAAERKRKAKAARTDDAEAAAAAVGKKGWEQAALAAIPALGDAAIPDLPDSLTSLQSGNDPMAGLRASTSFPVRLTYGGDKDEDGGWEDTPAETQDPSGLTRKYVAGACHFEVATGAFSVRSHLLKAKEGFAVEHDAYAPRSVLHPSEKKPLYLSVTTDLAVRVIDGTAKACAKSFAGRRVRFASVTLAGSELVATDLGSKTLTAHTVKNGASFDIYLGWDEMSSLLELTDRSGLATSVATGVLAFEPEAVGTYYLSFKPHWTITRAQKATAKLP